MDTHTCMHTDAGVRACTQMHTSACSPPCTPRHAPRRTRTCSHTQACPQMLPRPGPASGLLPVLRVTVTSGLACPPGSALPVAMAMLRLPGDEVCSPTLQRGAESSRGDPALPATPGSAQLPAPCGAAPGMSLLWLHQPSPGAGPSVLGSSCLTSHRPAVCRTRACAKACPLVGCPHSTMGSRLPPAILPRSKPCPVADRTQPAWTCPTVLPSLHRPWPCLWCPAAPGISRAQRGLQPPHAGCTIMGFTILTRAGTDPAGSHAEGTGCCHAVPCCAEPCHGSQQGRAEVERDWHS